MLCLLPLLACASTRPQLAPAPPSYHDRPQVEVAWSICAVTTTPDGRELNDAGVVVTLVARGASPERAAVGHVAGSCRPSGEGTPPPLVCQDPHVDRRTSITARRAQGILIVERRDQPTDPDGQPTPPEAPVVQVAALALPGDAPLVSGLSAGCR